MKLFIPLFMSCISSFICQAQPSPQKLHEGTISNDAVFGFTLSPKGDHGLWVQSNSGRRDTLVIMEAKIKKGKLLNKRVAPFSLNAARGLWRDIDPMFSPDGKTIYFQSTRPVPGFPARKGFDIWAIQKGQGGKWGEAFHLGNTINSDSSESYSSVSINGNMYFTLAKNGMTDIYVSKFIKGKYETPVALPSIINDQAERESNPFIAADESFIIYFSTKKAGLGEVDLYISFNKNGEWQYPVNIGAPVNSALAEFCPFYHAGQKRLYFSRQKKREGGGMIENIYSVDFDPAKYAGGK